MGRERSFLLTRSRKPPKTEGHSHRHSAIHCSSFLSHVGHSVTAQVLVLGGVLNIILIYHVGENTANVIGFMGKLMVWLYDSI